MYMTWNVHSIALALVWLSYSGRGRQLQLPLLMESAGIAPTFKLRAQEVANNMPNPCKAHHKRVLHLIPEIPQISTAVMFTSVHRASAITFCTDAFACELTALNNSGRSLEISPLEMNDGLDFVEWLESTLAHAPGRHDYPEVFSDAITSIARWRQRYSGNRKLWKALMKSDKILKELIEAAPVIAAVREFVKTAHLGPGERFTVLDLCSGKGFLSMFLSEMLPQDRVECCLLIDKAWPLRSAEPPLPHQINHAHIYGSDDVRGSYFDLWPIRLHTKKENLKDRSVHRQLKKIVFDKAPGPVVLLAIHLCGTLALRAIDLFNDNKNVKLFVLKPCCLPGIEFARRNESFAIGKHAFSASIVCERGKFVGSGSNRRWTGPPRAKLASKFKLWTHHLGQGVETDANGGKKTIEKRIVQTNGGFQNRYIFAERGPTRTKELWEAIANARKRKTE